jgi:uncharacterized protein
VPVLPIVAARPGCVQRAPLYRPCVLTVSALARYPVKSCRGEALDEAVVEPWGLAGDRRWMVVDADGEVITAREVHRLLLVRPQLVPNGLELTAPDLPALPVPVPDGRERMLVGIWGSHVDAACADPSADAWFTKLVGSTARLVYLDDPTARPTNPLRTRPEDRVSFADGYPLLLTSSASLDVLNDRIAEGPRADEGPLPMTRFRPSVVVDGAPAWAEDDWRELRIGGVPFRAVKGCDRCVLTTLDPDTAAKGMEPITTLARYRRFDGKTWFGINLVPDTRERRGVRVGDEIEIISAVAPGDGPMR